MNKRQFKTWSETRSQHNDPPLFTPQKDVESKIDYYERLSTGTGLSSSSLSKRQRKTSELSLSDVNRNDAGLQEQVTEKREELILKEKFDKQAAESARLISGLFGWFWLVMVGSVGDKRIGSVSVEREVDRVGVNDWVEPVWKWRK